MKKCLAFISIAALLTGILPCSTGLAAEHGGSPMAEHPGQTVTATEVKNAIKDHVKALSEATNGIFVIKDDKLGRQWQLRLDKIHDPVRTFEKDGRTVYFACSDFRAVDGPDVLDIDFWMVDKGGKLQTIDTRIHKVNGIPRFTYEGTATKEVR